MAVLRFLTVFVLLLACLSFGYVDSDDGERLLEIKKSFRDVDNVLYDWTDSPSSDYCVWRGVTCDNVTFNVNALNLSGLNLDGEISPSIGELKGLMSIDFRGNRFSGQIPDEIGDCTALTSLDLSFNELYGDIPFSISKLKQLECLILKNNQLIGPIPSTLSQIPNLKILDLAQNKLSGEIPRLIYWNEVLQYLGLRGNNLVGTLSLDICKFFDVRNNSLPGTIPQNIGNCTAFQVLDLSYNKLTGEIPFNIRFLQVATLYDAEATYFEGVRTAKQKQLEEKLLQLVQPAYQSMLGHLRTGTQDAGLNSTKRSCCLDDDDNGFCTNVGKGVKQ